MRIEDTLILFVAFCLGLCTYGMVTLVRAVKAWRERRIRAKAGEAHPKGESRRRLVAASVLGVLSTLLGGGLVALIVPTMNQGGSIAGYRMAFALMLLGLGIACVIVGARWDRAKGRRRCPKCWYSYEGFAADAKCPECGRVARSERDLLRTRRKPLLYGVLPLMIAAAWISYIAPVAKSWRSYIPTTVMIAGYGWMPEYLILHGGGGDDDCLECRLNDDRLAGWQVRWVAGRAAKVLQATSDQARGANACRHIETLLGQGARPELSDAARCALRLVPTGKSFVPNFDVNHLFVFATRHLTPESPLDASDIALLLSWQKLGGRGGQWSSSLLMRMAPGTTEVIDTLFEEATSEPYGEDQQAAAIALGQIAARTPGLVENLRHRFDNLDGDPQFAIGIALTSSYLTPAAPGESATGRARVAEANGMRFASLLQAEGLELIGCALEFNNGASGIEIAPGEPAPIVSQLAAAHEEVRWSGIGWMCSNDAITDNDVPTLIAFLDAHPGSPFFIAAVCRDNAASPAWLPFKPRFEEYLERFQQSQSTPQFRLQPLVDAIARLKAIERSSESETQSP